MLTSTAWTVVIAGIPMMVTAGCGPSGGGNPTTDTYTSTITNGHTHDITIAIADFDAPPVGGFDGSTTQSGGHTHTVTLTQDQLKSIGGGGSVTVSTTVAGGHLHDFTFTRKAGSGGGGGGGNGY